MKIHEGIEQGSVEWFLLRSGRVTASTAEALVTNLGKVKTGDAAKTLLVEILAENWVGGPLPSFQGALDCENGKILEERARPCFTLETGKAVKEVSFIEGDDERTGCSPDGILTDEKAGLEIKSPRMENHIRYLLDGIVPADYVIQVQFSLYVTQWPRWYFMSYRSQFPPLILKVEPDEKIQSAIKTALDVFFENYEAAFKKLVETNGGLPNPKQRGKVPFRAPKTEPHFDLMAGA